MANLVQLKMLEDLNAFLCVDKPAGLAFSSIVKAVKRKFNLVKVGHGGSLDAMASGLVVVLVNDANKFTGEVMGADRAWEGTLRLGLKTDTGDLRGRTTERAGFAMAADAFAAALERVKPEFKGDIFQTEPRYAAIRREGSGEYEIADTGDHSPSLVHVYRLDFGELVPREDGTAEIGFTATGTKGFLPRVFADDFGAALGCGAALSSLRRTRVGKFGLDRAVRFDDLLGLEMKDFASCTIPLGEALR